MSTPENFEMTRQQVQTAAAVCEDKKGVDTRILQLDPIDSGLADFFLITSATNDRQSVAIADEIELRLKREFGLYAHSVEGRRTGEWILLDYVDFVVHVFLAERRAFYDIERLRKSATPFTPSEFETELDQLKQKTADVRKKADAKPAAKKTAAKKAAPAKKVAAVVPAAPAVAVPVAKKAVAKKTIAKPVAKKAVAKKAR
jgi:ribosome-associated protein